MKSEAKDDNKILLEVIKKLVEEGRAFEFLKDEEDIYSKEDIKEPETSLNLNRRTLRFSQRTQSLN